MPRPHKCCRIESLPDALFFKPSGIPMERLEEVGLSIEEAEALRLKDLSGLDQETAAEKMNVSRPTFQRILASARRKVSDAILNAKALRISGGNVEMTFSRYRCLKGHQWDIPREAAVTEGNEICPTCKSPGRKAMLK